jgi:hypothetical protein
LTVYRHIAVHQFLISPQWPSRVLPAFLFNPHRTLGFFPTFSTLIAPLTKAVMVQSLVPLPGCLCECMCSFTPCSVIRHESLRRQARSPLSEIIPTLVVVTAIHRNEHDSAYFI